MIAHARHDENGKYTNGIAGDQTGGEVCITEWYYRPWDVIVRPKKRKIAWKIADTMTDACINNYIGYDQNERTTLYNEAVKVNFDLKKINHVCECDCSSLVAVAVNASGIKVSKDIYTGNMVKALTNTGEFTLVTDKEVLQSENYLLRGDILVYENHHTAVCLTDGKSIKIYKTGWQKNNFKWWYADTPTTYYHDCFKIINHYKYYFDADGYAYTGAHYINKGWYYFKQKLTPQENGSLECALCFTDENGILMPKYFN